MKNKEDITMRDAYLLADDVLNQAIKGISGIITGSGIINTDFADIKATMSGQGDALLGIGVGRGANRAEDAANTAINNPLLENINIDGAKTLLINITAGESLRLNEVSTITNIITSTADPYHKVFLGHVVDPEMAEDEVSVTVIATGFSNGGTQIPAQSGSSINRVNDNVVSDDEFKGLFESGAATFDSPRSNSIFAQDEAVQSSAPVMQPVQTPSESAQPGTAASQAAHSLGDAIASSYRRGPGYNYGSESIDVNDINLPACRRRLSREINLRDDK